MAKGTAQAQRAFKTACLISVFIIMSKKIRFPGEASQQARPSDLRTPAREPKKASVLAFLKQTIKLSNKGGCGCSLYLKTPTLVALDAMPGFRILELKQDVEVCVSNRRPREEERNIWSSSPVQATVRPFLKTNQTSNKTS